MDDTSEETIEAMYNQISEEEADVIDFTDKSSDFNINNLPDEILVHIFGYVEQVDRNRLSLLCHRFYNVCKDTRIAEHCTVDFRKLVSCQHQFLCGFFPVSGVIINDSEHFKTNELQANVELPRLTTLIIPYKLNYYRSELCYVLKCFPQATTLVLLEKTKSRPLSGTYLKFSEAEMHEMLAKSKIQKVVIHAEISRGWFRQFVSTILTNMPQLNEVVLPKLHNGHTSLRDSQGTFAYLLSWPLSPTTNFLESLSVLLEQRPIILTLANVDKAFVTLLGCTTKRANLGIKAESITFDFHCFDAQDMELIQFLDTILIACKTLRFRNFQRGAHLGAFGFILSKAQNVVINTLPWAQLRNPNLFISDDTTLSCQLNKIKRLRFNADIEIISYDMQFQVETILQLLQRSENLQHLYTSEAFLLKLFEMKSHLLERFKHIEVSSLSWTESSPTLNVNLSHNLKHLKLPDLTIRHLKVDCKIVQPHSKSFQHLANQVRQVDNLELLNVDDLNVTILDSLERLGQRCTIQTAILDKWNDRLKNLKVENIMYLVPN